MGDDEAIRQLEFGRVLDLQKQLHEALIREVREMRDGIYARQDRTNGRLLRAEEDVRELREEVQTLRVEGCSQYRAHRELLEGDAPARWKRPAKAGVVGAGAIALFELAKAVVERWR